MDCNYKYKYQKYKTKYLKAFPKYILIGTVHDTQKEQDIFAKLGTYTKQNPKYEWFCEGEPDFRNCKTLKDYKTHLVTDCLFVYMVHQDCKKNPQDQHLQQERIDRFIELLITVARVQNKSKFIKLFDNYPQISQSIAAIEQGHPIKQSTLKKIEIELKNVPHFMAHLDTILASVCKCARNCGFIKDADWQVVQKFLQNTECLVDGKKKCEDYIFMQMRDHAFLDIIGKVQNIGNKTYIITVGSAHVPFLEKHLQRIGQVKVLTL